MVLKCYVKSEAFVILFKNYLSKSVTEIENFLSNITPAPLIMILITFLKKTSSETDLYSSIKSMQNNKSPRNNGLTKEFYECFCNEIKEMFINSVIETKNKGELSTSKRQAIVKLIEKKI